MVAVERVSRYVEQLDAIQSSRQDSIDRAAVQRHLKSKIVSKIVLWTLQNRRRFRETVLCAEPPLPVDEYCDQHTQSDARECKTWIGPQEFVREYVVMDDTLRIDEFDDGDTDTDECRDDVEEDRRRNISDGAIHPRGSFAFDRKPNHPTDVLVNTGTLLTGVRYPEKPHRTKSFSVECVGREHDIESTITDQVHRTIEELREDTDRLAPSSAGAKEMIQVEVKVFRQLHEPPSSIETYSKSSHVTMDQLEVPKSPSMGSWFWRWSTKGCWSYGL
jgi:hypothetical protein